MLVDNSIYRNAYVANGSSKSFAISFPFLTAKHIQVFRGVEDENDVLIPASEYTISGAGNENGGTLVMNTTPASGTRIVILRNVPITQLYAYKELDNFSAESHENALAKLTMIDQQQQEQIDRSVKLPVTDPRTPEQYAQELFDAHEEVISMPARLEAQLVSIGNRYVLMLEEKVLALLGAANAFNGAAVVEIREDMPEGSVIELPELMQYVVGSNMLILFYNGTVGYEGQQYKEVGDLGSTSRTVQMLHELRAGDMLQFRVIALHDYGVTATNTTMPRKLSDRFADVINVKDFGAKGDGVTDDTAAFEAAGATGKAVFVPSGKYIISRTIRGDFVSMDAELAKTNGVPSDRFLIMRHIEKAADYRITGGYNPINIFTASQSEALMTSDQRGAGSYSRAAVQSVAWDAVNNSLYMLHLKDYLNGSSGARYASISRHAVSGESTLSTADISVDLGVVGHQGLAVEPRSGGSVKLWASAQYGTSGDVVRFDYVPNGGAGNIETYHMVDYYGSVISMSPAISYDGRYLLVTYRAPVDGATESRVRVFSLADVLASKTKDCSDLYLHEFTVETEGFQSMACDGQNVYILASSTTTSTPATIYWYTIEGAFVGKNSNLTYGFSEAEAVGSTYCEAESLFFMPIEGRVELCIGVCVASDAEGSAKKLNIYSCSSVEGFRPSRVRSITVSNNDNTEVGFVKREVEFERTGTAPVSAKIGGFYHNDKNGKRLGGVTHHLDNTNSSFLNLLVYDNKETDKVFSVRLITKSDGSNGLFVPYSGSISLGNASKKWTEIFASTATINTSDAREKTAVTAPDEALMRAWGKVNFKAFQFTDAVEKKGEEARIHFGVLAQQVAEAFASEGLDASRYALFCYDRWEDEWEEQEDGTKVLVTPAGDRYGIRYSEALALECAYQRWLGEKREARIAALEKIVGVNHV